MGRPDNVYHEIELKFSIPKSRVEEVKTFLSSLGEKRKLQVVDIQEIQQTDNYFDSGAFDLGRHRCSLRERRAGASRVMTFKGANVWNHEALNKRIEIEGIYGRRTLDKVTDNAPWLLFLDKPEKLPAASRIKYKALYEVGLNQVLTIANHRTVYFVEYDGQMRLELCFDQVSASSARRTTTFFELEGEFVSGDIAKLEDFEKYLRKNLSALRASGVSKYERSLKSLKIWRRDQALNDRTIRKWNNRLNKVLRRFNKYYALMLEFSDEEDLHKCRVSLRQLITLLGFLGEAGTSKGRLARLRERFKKIQKILGGLRDRDVYLIYAATHPAFQMASEQIQLEFLHIVQMERDQQRLKALSRLPKYVNKVLRKEWDLLLSNYLAKLVGEAHVEAQYVALVHKFEKARLNLIDARKNLGPSHPQTVKKLHKARILVKRLRYVSLYLSFALPGDTKLIVPAFTHLQDSMGEINDVYNHIGHTRMLAHKFENLLGPFVQPMMDKMNADLDTKLNEFEIGDLRQMIHAPIVSQ